MSSMGTERSGLPGVRDAISSATKIVVVGHVTPDADCLASMLGVASLLAKRKGKSAAIELPGGRAPGRLAFLLDLVSVEIADDPWRRTCDTVVVVDTARSSRMNSTTGWDPLDSGKTVINVDHHAPNPGYGTVNWVEGCASSTSELIYRLYADDGSPLDAGTASVLYSGIYGDTAGFSLPNTTAFSLETAAKLVRAGADVALIGEKLDRSQRKCDFDLLRIIYDHTRLVDNGRIACSTADYKEITESGCVAHDIDDQVLVPRSLERIYVAILFTEGVRGKIRLNLRGERGLGVLELARKLGGGGHHYAAGTIIDGKMDDVVDRVLKEASAYIDQQLAKG